ncbi:MAG: SPOR domain-containing protein [Aquabacterium sp.]|nr:SPOR domain-containing protein [Aquabacterium sp.]
MPSQQGRQALHTATASPLPARMGLLSYFKRNAADAGESSAAAPDPIENARTRARRRLIGATVLLGIGVVGFPLVFESQPRPIPVDIPIEIPRREAAAPLVVPPAPRPGPSIAPSLPPVAEDVPASAVAAKPASRPAAELPTERAAEQGREVGPAVSRPAAARGALPAASVAVAPKPLAPASASRAASAAARSDDGRRAQALLEGRPQAAAASPAVGSAPGARLVVQVGAYTDADKLRDARARVEKLGLKTYTQVIESDGGKRTRVRVGPFATRDEADKAAARIRAAGLPVAILAL